MRAQVPVAEDVWTLALDRAAHVLDRFDHTFVSFSGGKDSTVTLHAALEAAHADPAFHRHLPMRVVFFDEECIPQETADYVARIAQRDDVNLEWYCLPVRHRNACSRTSPWWWPWAPEDRERWARPLPEGALTTLAGFPVEPPSARYTIPQLAGLLAPPELGNVGMFMGIRAVESRIRLRAVRVRSEGEETNYVKHYSCATDHGNLWKAYPVYDWSVEDVWTAPAKFGWDYNHAYDLMEMAGVSHTAQRCSPAFGEEPLHGLHQFAECFPDVWEKMTDRVPGVGAAVRYARTELWGFGSNPEKPAGMPWPDFITHYVDQYRPKDARTIKHTIRAMISGHYQRTSQPIAARAKHPHTDISWGHILNVAIRGDFKSRRAAAQHIIPSLYGEHAPYARWRKYADDIQAHLDDGTFAELGHPGRTPASGDSLIPAYAWEEADEQPGD